MKVAICLSGQLRTFKETAASIKKLFSSFDTDYFLSSWNDGSDDPMRALEIFRPKEHLFEVPQMVQKEIQKTKDRTLYSSLQIVHGIHETKRTELYFPFHRNGRRFLELHDHSEWHPNSNCNPECIRTSSQYVNIPLLFDGGIATDALFQFYKVETASALCQKYSKETNTHYDYIVRARFDCELFSTFTPFEFDELTPNQIKAFLAPGITPRISDQVFYGRPQAMFKMQRIYSQIIDNLEFLEQIAIPLCSYGYQEGIYWSQARRHNLDFHSNRGVCGDVYAKTIRNVTSGTKKVTVLLAAKDRSQDTLTSLTLEESARLTGSPGDFSSPLPPLSKSPLLTNRPHVLHRYCRYLLKNGEFLRSILVFKKIIEIDPTNTKLYCELSSLLRNQGNIKAALKYLQFAFTIDPSSYSVWTEFALHHLTTNDYDSAERVYRHLVQEYPDRALSYLKLAEIELFKLNYSSAKELVNKVLLLEPENEVAQRLHSNNFHYNDNISTTTNLSDETIPHTAVTDQYQQLIISQLREFFNSEEHEEMLVFIEKNLLDITIAAEHPNFNISLILGFLESRKITPENLHAIVKILNKAQTLLSYHPAIKSWTIPVFSTAYMIASYLVDDGEASLSSPKSPIYSISDSTLVNSGTTIVSIFQTYVLKGVVTWPLLEYLFPILSERVAMLISSGYRSKGILVIVLYLRLFYSRNEFLSLLRELSPLLLSLSFKEIMLISGNRFLICSSIEDKLFLLFTEELLSIPAEPCIRETLVILILLEHCPHDLKQGYEEQLLSVCARLLKKNNQEKRSPVTAVDSEELLVLLWAEARGGINISLESKQQIPQPLRLLCTQAAQTRRVITKKKSRSMIPKIALCVSGQLRNWTESVSNWADVLYPHADIDTYVHTWSIAGKRSNIFSRALPEKITKTLRQLSQDNDGSSLIKDYPSIQRLLSFDLPAPDVNEIARIYNTPSDRIVVEDDNLPQYSSMSNSEKMIYKIKSCHQLMERNGKQYDLVIRIRPDFTLTPAAWFSWNDVYHQLVSQFRIGLADSALTTTSISFFANDTFAIGTPEVMALYAQCSEIPQFARKDEKFWSFKASSHAALGWGLWLLGVKATPVSGLQGRVVRDSSPLDLEELRKAVVRDSLGRMTENDKALLFAIESELKN